MRAYELALACFDLMHVRILNELFQLLDGAYFKILHNIALQCIQHFYSTLSQGPRSNFEIGVGGGGVGQH